MSIKSTLLFLLISSFVSKPSVSNAQAVNVQDSLALVDLYNSTNGPGWLDNDNWLTNKPVEQWWGISVINGRVIIILLSYNLMSGTIPSALGNIDSLGFLDLSGNNLTGHIPVELGRLGNLIGLHLSYNKLNGGIPPDLGNLKNLQELYLASNKLGGSIPPELGNLKNLHYLYLNSDELSGSIPSELGNLLNLKELYLIANQLTGSIPSEIGNLINLSILYLPGNQLTGNIPPQLGKLTSLVYLSFEGNQLTGNIPSELGHLKNLKSLYLDFNKLSGYIPGSLGHLYDLENLFLNNNKLSGSIPESLGDLSYLESGTFISFNRFTFNGMEKIARNPNNVYSPQANIPIHQNNNYLYVSAGGTLSNNTYKWFMVGAPDSTTVAGDSVFYPSQNGKYFAKVTNSICTKLTLYTDTVEYAVVLPVTITNLKAKQQGSTIKVDWSSLTEINVAGYEIQRSLNVRDFTAIGSLTAKGNGTQQQDYFFNDLQPLRGNNYYRLKVIDKDGKIDYSNIALVTVSDYKTVILIYPVPAKDILHIQTNGNTSFSLINHSGKILLTTNINGNGSINVAGFAMGLYYLKNNSNGEVQKIIIAK